jgi:hypothetical protein
VIGGRKSGKTNTLMLIGKTFADRGGEVFVLGGDEWKSFCAETGATLFTGVENPEWEAFMEKMLQNYIIPRNIERKKADNKEQAAKIAAGFKPFVLLIDNVDAYCDLGGKQFTPKDATLLGQLVSQASNFGMYTFCSAQSGNLRSRGMQDPLKSLIDQQRGIALGGRLGDVDPWNVALPYRQKNAALPMGTAWYISGDTYRQVVLPLLVEE